MNTTLDADVIANPAEIAAGLSSAMRAAVAAAFGSDGPRYIGGAHRRTVAALVRRGIASDLASDVGAELTDLGRGVHALLTADTREHGDQAETIASNLTDAQRRALVSRLNAVGAVSVHLATARVLEFLGLAVREESNWIKLTDLGRAVRMAVQSVQPAPMRQQPEQQHQAADAPARTALPTREEDDVLTIDDALAVIKKLSDPMKRAVTAPELNGDISVVWGNNVLVERDENGVLTILGARVGTSVALMDRGVLGAGRYVSSGNIVHDFTPLGTLVRRVLVEGEDAVRRDLESPAVTEQLPAPEEWPLPGDVDDHTVLVFVSRHEVLADADPSRPVRYLPISGNSYCDQYRAALMRVAACGLIEGKDRRFASWGVRPQTIRLTDQGARLLFAWDLAFGRNRFSLTTTHATRQLPPRVVLAAMPTKGVVKEYSEYYISGPGRVLADQVSCSHGYRLTDSCPCC